MMFFKEIMFRIRCVMVDFMKGKYKVIQLEFNGDKGLCMGMHEFVFLLVKHIDLGVSYKVVIKLNEVVFYEGSIPNEKNCKYDGYSINEVVKSIIDLKVYNDDNKTYKYFYDKFMYSIILSSNNMIESGFKCDYVDLVIVEDK
jgi:hypothetical protein